MAIRLLDPHVAELIAAGEVVERPASVVKELVENAIDAGATQVHVQIERGGTRLIQVEDNGSGIDAGDIPLAFQRHATSKVRTQQDLDSIHTLGFRGEALASIASVAKVQLLTKTAEDEFASLYTIEGGDEKGIEVAARPLGTTFTVREIFYNTPARMKFLKKDVTEGGYVTETVTRLRLSHPEIAFRYTRDAKQVFHTPGDGKLQSAAWAVLGGDFAKELAEVASENGKYAVQGLISKPHAVRASRSMQFFFINGRFVKNRTMMAALEQAYRGMIMQGKFPGCVLFLQMPAELVDVNVHPAKTEVRFAYEKEVFDAVYRAVKGTLSQAAATHRQFSLTGENNKESAPADVRGNTWPEATQAVPPADGTSAAPRVSSFNFINPAASAGALAPQATGAAAQPNIQETSAGAVCQYNDMVGTLASSGSFAPYETKPIMPPPQHGLDILPEEKGEPPILPLAAVPGTEEPLDSAPPTQTSFTGAEAQDDALRLVGEVFRTYILAQRGEVLCVIDKHAAHERLIYEQLVENRGEADAQQLLSPVTVTLSASEKDALLQNGEALAAAGIEVEDFGGNGVLVRGVPADVEPTSISDLVVEVAKRLAVNSRDNMNEKTEWVLHSVSCRAAMKAGDKTPAAQLLELAQRILDGKIPPFCPHGRPVVLEISRKELEKQFGRLG